MSNLKDFCMNEKNAIGSKKPLQNILETENYFIASDGIIAGIEFKDNNNIDCLPHTEKQYNTYDILIKVIITENYDNRNYFTFDVPDFKKVLEKMIIELKLEYAHYKQKGFKLSNILVRIFISDKNIISVYLEYDFKYGNLYQKIYSYQYELISDNKIDKFQPDIILNYRKMLQFLDFLKTNEYKQLTIYTCDKWTITASNKNRFALLFKYVK